MNGTSTRPPTALRSITPGPASPSSSRLEPSSRLAKSSSTPNINGMVAAVAGPQLPFNPMRDDGVMDTRTPSPLHRADTDESGGAQYRPDLSAEVSMLSTKLVNAINYQTNLDDSLQHTRHELDQTRQDLARAQAEKQYLDELVAGGILLRKTEVDETVAKLKAELATERAAKEAAERSRKQTEAELESLTSALFEEANTMVAAARKDTEAVERRNMQLKTQIADTEMLLVSQQEQLQSLKLTMERLESEPASIPSTPVISQSAVMDALNLSPNHLNSPDFFPEHPLHFSQLVVPVLRHDTSAYSEFQDLLVLARRLGAHSRNDSTSAGQQLSASQLGVPSASTSTPNLPGAFSFSGGSSPISPTYNAAATLPALKETKFYKRVLLEDIEPVLRLELAPGLTFLSRRTVISSLHQGNLAVEPVSQNKHYFACALCGESRRAEPYVRKYRLRTSEDDTVPKPLCDFCVARVRVSGDFVGFLRMVRDGHWKCDTEADQHAAWEESVRLRERMFWARIGGGVVPSIPQPSTQKASPPSPSTAPLEDSDDRSQLGNMLHASPQGSAAIHAGRSTDDGDHALGISNAGEDLSPRARDADAPHLPPAPRRPGSNPTLEEGFSTPPTSHQRRAVDRAASPREVGRPPLAPRFSNPSSLVQGPRTSFTRGAGSDLPRPASGYGRTLSPERPSASESESEQHATGSEDEARSPAGDTATTPRNSITERKNSSVLARVRAMEASKQGGDRSST